MTGCFQNMVIDCVEGSEIHRPGPACRLLPEPLLHFPCGSFGKGNHKNGRRIHITFFYQMKNTLDNCISFSGTGPRQYKQGSVLVLYGRHLA